MEENEPGPPLAGLIVLFIGAAFITVGVAFLTYGLYALIRTGLWPAYPFSKMLTEIGVAPAQLPADGAIGWLLAQSACVVLLAIGSVIAGLGAWLIARFNRRREAEAEMAAAQS